MSAQWKILPGYIKVNTIVSATSKYLTPFWIIITLIMFRILPHVLLAIYVLYLKQYQETVRTTVVVLLRTGFVVDQIIHVYKRWKQVSQLLFLHKVIETSKTFYKNSRFQWIATKNFIFLIFSSFLVYKKYD